ncbi:hypothetical protein ASE94_08385 [Devosia sp. Leaf64]|nr:hypothetical protein ASE94_08385 [Devosia sp. Leaf64]
MGVQAIFMGWGAALPIPPGMDLPFGMGGQERPPHPPLRVDLSPRGRGEAWFTIAGVLKAIATSFPRKRESLPRRRDSRFRGNDAVSGEARAGFEEASEQTRRLREYCLLRGRVGL